MTIDHADWNTSADRALKAYTQGAALARKAGADAANTSQVIAGGGSAVLVNLIAWNQPGWEANFQASLPAASGTKPFAKVHYVWFDGVNLIPVVEDDRYISLGNGNLNGIQTGGYGPAKGDVLQVSLINLDPAQSLTVSWSMQQTSHLYPKDKWRQVLYGGIPPNGFTYPGGSLPGLVLMSSAPTLLPATPQSFLLGTWQGSARIMIDNTAGANAVKVVVADAVGDINPAPQWLNDTVNAGTRFREDMPFIAKPVLVTLTNTGGAGNISPVITVTATDD